MVALPHERCYRAAGDTAPPLQAAVHWPAAAPALAAAAAADARPEPTAAASQPWSNPGPKPTAANQTPLKRRHSLLAGRAVLLAAAVCAVARRPLARGALVDLSVGIAAMQARRGRTRVRDAGKVQQAAFEVRGRPSRAAQGCAGLVPGAPGRGASRGRRQPRLRRMPLSLRILQTRLLACFASARALSPGRACHAACMFWPQTPLRRPLARPTLAPESCQAESCLFPKIVIHGRASSPELDRDVALQLILEANRLHARDRLDHRRLAVRHVADRACGGARRAGCARGAIGARAGRRGRRGRAVCSVGAVRRRARRTAVDIPAEWPSFAAQTPRNNRPRNMHTF